MMAAVAPVQRPRDARLLAVDRFGLLSDHPRAALLDLLRPGDLVIANDAATLPASLRGIHIPSGDPIEVRLVGRRSLDPSDVCRFSAIVFGEGDFRTRTEDRPAPPPLRTGDRLALGPLTASVTAVLGHPRFVRIHCRGSTRQIWEGLACHGRPIQYSHLQTALAVWDTWTPIAGTPVAFEPPSAGFALDWQMLRSMPARRIEFATITHAAGISSTGDPELDSKLPFDEPYRIPPSTAFAIRRAKQHGGRVIAIGTTVVRALEHAASGPGLVWSGENVAMGRLGPDSALQVVDAILTGTHEPGTSHYELLRAFAGERTLTRMDRELHELHYKTHDFGDSAFLERCQTDAIAACNIARANATLNTQPAYCPPQSASASSPRGCSG